MSAFFVGNNSISKLANEIIKYRKDMGSDAKGLALKLYDMNFEALEARYSEQSLGMMEKFEYDDGAFFDGEAQFYKSLQCYLYQCNEGDVDESKLYKEIEKVCNALAHIIAGRWADKQGAKWE